MQVGQIVYLDLSLFFLFVALAVIAFILLGWTIVNEFFLMPSDAKTLRRSKMGGGRAKGLYWVTSDEGHTKLRLGTQLSRGIVNIGVKNKPEYIMLPRPFEINPQSFDESQKELVQLQAYRLPNVDEKGELILPELMALIAKNIDARVKTLQEYVSNQKELLTKGQANVEFALQRNFEEGINKPVYHVYTGKAVAMTAQVLALLGLSAETGTSIRDTLFRYGVFVDSRILKLVIPKLYTPGQMGEVANVSERKGAEDQKSSQSKYFFPIMILLMAVLVMVIIAKVAGLF